MTIPYIMGRDSITVAVNGATSTVREGQANYAALREAIKSKDWDAIPDLLTPAKAVETFGAGNIKIVNGEVTMNGRVLRNGVTARILQMVAEGFDAAPLMKFLENLMANPSKTAVDELYDWLEGTSLPITEDGYFLAYKKVRDDYLSFYDGKTSNRVGETPNMPRNEVNDDRDQTCSQGLHFCSMSYLGSYYGGQGRVMILKINPADVVSIPSDYDFAKGRAWQYLVIGEHEGGEKTEAFDTPVVSATGAPVYGTVRKAAAAPVTAVLGVEFGTVARAELVNQAVKAAMSSSVAHLSAAVSGAQARVDGFDDAWSNAAPDLSRSRSTNAREVVAYAQAYFEGYDKCMGATTQAATSTVDHSLADDYDWETDEERAEINKLLNSVKDPATTRHGSENGYDDGHDDGYNDARLGNKFNLSRALGSGKGYRAAYVEGYLDSYSA